MRKLSFFALLLVGSTHVFAQKLPFPQLQMGSGGGVTGQTITYILLENGKIYKQNSLKPDSLVLNRTLFASTAKKYLAEAKKLALTKRKFDEPGNMSFFVRYATTSKSEEAVVWGANGKTPPKEVKAFYEKFMKNLVRK